MWPLHLSDVPLSQIGEIQRESWRARRERERERERERAEEVGGDRAKRVPHTDASQGKILPLYSSHGLRGALKSLKRVIRTRRGLYIMPIMYYYYQATQGLNKLWRGTTSRTEQKNSLSLGWFREDRPSGGFCGFRRVDGIAKGILPDKIRLGSPPAGCTLEINIPAFRPEESR